MAFLNVLVVVVAADLYATLKIALAVVVLKAVPATNLSLGVVTIPIFPSDVSCKNAELVADAPAVLTVRSITARNPLLVPLAAALLLIRAAIVPSAVVPLVPHRIVNVLA